MFVWWYSLYGIFQNRPQCFIFTTVNQPNTCMLHSNYLFTFTNCTFPPYTINISL